MIRLKKKSVATDSLIERRGADIMVAKGFPLPIHSSLISGALNYAYDSATRQGEVGELLYRC